MFLRFESAGLEPEDFCWEINKFGKNSYFIILSSVTMNWGIRSIHECAPFYTVMVDIDESKEILFVC